LSRVRAVDTYSPARRVNAGQEIDTTPRVIHFIAVERISDES
jgi:hypothetical protein